jgi:hypothetical protein
MLPKRGRVMACFLAANEQYSGRGGSLGRVVLTWIQTSSGTLSFSIKSRIKPNSVSEAEGKPASISLNPHSIRSLIKVSFCGREREEPTRSAAKNPQSSPSQAGQIRLTCAGVIGFTSDWLPSRRLEGNSVVEGGWRREWIDLDEKGRPVSGDGTGQALEPSYAQQVARTSCQPSEEPW